MLGGNTEWVKLKTLLNMNRIYESLLPNTNFKAKGDAKRQQRFTYMQIAKATGIDRKQVKTAVHIMAYQKKPLVKIIASHTGKKESFKIAYQIELIRKL